MEEIPREDLEEIDAIIAELGSIISELEIARGRGDLLICTVPTPAYRQGAIHVIEDRFPVHMLEVEGKDELISALMDVGLSLQVLIWVIPTQLDSDLLEALNDFPGRFFEAGVSSVLFLSPSATDDVIREAPDLWRSRGGYHELKGREEGFAVQALEAMASQLRYKNKDDLKRWKGIYEHILQTVPENRVKVKFLLELGVVHVLLDEVRPAIDRFSEGRRIALEIGDRRGERTVLGHLGSCYRDQGELRRAIEVYEQALAIDRESGDRWGECLALGNLGSLYVGVGDPLRAIELLDETFSIAREMGDRQTEGFALGNLGNASRALGEPRMAFEFNELRLIISREIGDRRGEGLALSSMGDACSSLGEMQRAVEFYERALAIDREIGDRKGEGIDMWNLCLVMEQLGRQAYAADCAREALAIFEETESPYTDRVRRQLNEWMN